MCDHFWAEGCIGSGNAIYRCYSGDGHRVERILVNDGNFYKPAAIWSLQKDGDSGGLIYIGAFQFKGDRGYPHPNQRKNSATYYYRRDIRGMMYYEREDDHGKNYCSQSLYSL